VLGQFGVSGDTRAAILRLASLSGDVKVLDEAARVFAFCPAAASAVAELRVVVEALDAAGLGDRVAVDLSEVRGLEYYTGLVFRAYAEGLGFEVGAGGRYDTLLARFGRPMGAVGFMLGLDRLALLRERQGTANTASPTAAEPIVPTDLGPALRDARARRAAGRRIRFDGGRR
jgi:ATP phosphoribosyltransferase regulatory subunit